MYAECRDIIPDDSSVVLVRTSESAVVVRKQASEQIDYLSEGSQPTSCLDSRTSQMCAQKH